MAFNEALYKRGTGAQGGQFVAKDGTKSSAIGYDGTRGSGYGSKGGDSNVKALQKELNRLGITDAQGKELVVDGKFGPKTTAAVRRLQKKLGVPVDGKITPALLKRIKGVKKTTTLTDAKPAAKKTAAPAGKKAAPARPAGPPPRKITPRKAAPVKRSVRYSSGMTDDLERHGSHNQKSHGNRLGKPTNVGGKTGLAKATALLADKPEQGPERATSRTGTGKVRPGDRVEIVKHGSDIGGSALQGKKGMHAGWEGDPVGSEWDRAYVEMDDGRTELVPRRNLKVDKSTEDIDAEAAAAPDAPLVPARRKLSAVQIQDILKGDREWYMGNSRRNEEHLRILKDAGISDEQAREILTDLGAKPDREWETTDLGRTLHDRAERETQTKAEAERLNRLKVATPAAFARLLGTDGKEAMVKSKATRPVFEAMQASGWNLTAVTGHGGYTFSSPDGERSINILTINGVKVYDKRHNKISGVKALAYVKGSP